MATPAQLAEKLRQDRLGLDQASSPTPHHPSSSSPYATPAQLAETVSSFATPAQLAEKTLTSEFATPAQLAEKAQRRGPPPLPPRASSVQAPPPAYSPDDARRSQLMSEQWRSHDPRSSSTHSLVPSESQRDGRRKLLLVYIHGFMGNELSFQSFPAHTHNLLTIALAESHIVHTKLYPRYKSRNSIQVARDDFSNWLEPHENHETDIVLLGHSMGGILAAEVVLQQPPSLSSGKPLRHRILGMIGFDTPFLGMHPGVVVSGIGSLFRPAPEPPGATTSESSASGVTTPMASHASASSVSYATSTIGSIESSQPSLMQSISSPLATPPLDDPHYDAPFPNDVHLPERKGWSSLLHFINKHSDGLIDATKSYFMSHIEFGSCLADYPGMKMRYEKIRALEDVKEAVHRDGSRSQVSAQRVRFLNYYTASTGRPKTPKAPAESHVGRSDAALGIDTGEAGQPRSINETPKITPNIFVDEHNEGASTPRQLDEAPTQSQIEAEMLNLGRNSGIYDEDSDDEFFEMQEIESMPIDENEDPLPQPSLLTKSEFSDASSHEAQSTTLEPALPPIPDLQAEPEAIDLDLYKDKDERKIAEKEQKRLIKAYQQAVKDRESAIKDRKKLLEKREKKAKQETEKKLKFEEKQRSKEEKESTKRKLQEEKATEKGKGKDVAMSEEPRLRQGSGTPSVREERPKKVKPKRDKKFCMLPPTVRGKMDKCWVRIYMEGVDEVGAHCGLFWPGPQYQSFVGDLGAKIEQWVKDATANRAMLDDGRV